MNHEGRVARRSDALGVLVTLAIIGAATAGCEGPAKCSDFEQAYRLVYVPELTRDEGGGFSIARRGHFDSCETFCAVEPGVQFVHGCQGPTPNTMGYARIMCDVEVAECTSATIIGLPR